MNGRHLLASLVTFSIAACSTAALAQQSGAPSHQNETQTAETDGYITPIGSTTYESGEADSECSCGADKGSEACSCKKLEALNTAVAGAHKGVFYNNNFDYLCDPCYCDSHLGDRLKRQSVGQCITYDVGGQYRMRFHNERNMRGLGLTGRDDRFLLQRTRVYANVEVGDRFRFYGEMIDAVSDFETLAPRPIEENRADILNMLIDVKLFDGCCGELWGRIGR